MKLILQYFKPVPAKEKKEDTTPHGPLSSKIPPGAIKAANEQALCIFLDSNSICSYRNHFQLPVYTSVHRLMMDLAK